MASSLFLASNAAILSAVNRLVSASAKGMSTQITSKTAEGISTSFLFFLKKSSILLFLLLRFHPTKGFRAGKAIDMRN